MSALTNPRFVSFMESVQCHLNSKLRFAVGNEDQTILHDMETAQLIMENTEQIGDATIIHHTRAAAQPVAAE